MDVGCLTGHHLSHRTPRGSDAASASVQCFCAPCPDDMITVTVNDAVHDERAEAVILYVAAAAVKAK